MNSTLKAQPLTPPVIPALLNFLATRCGTAFDSGRSAALPGWHAKMHFVPGFLLATIFAALSASSPALSQTCTNLCLQQVACPGTGTTSISGFVYDPANNLPLPNVLVYNPNSSVQPFTPGVACGITVSGSPLVATTTSISGSFTLTNVPVGSSIPIVIQTGIWRRQFTIPTVPSCVNTVVSNGTFGSHLTLPSTHSQGNIPLIAIDTGAVDSMECILSKMGVSTAEFVDPAIVNGVPTAAGRVHFYQGSIYNGGAIIDGNTPTEDVLLEQSTTLNSYDIVLFPCQGGAGTYTAPNGWPNTLGNLVSYANAGGRVLADHYHYDLIDGNGSFSGTATWAPGSGEWGNIYSDPTYNADIDSFARGVVLADWLHQASVYGGTQGVIPVGVIRKDFTAVNAGAQRWLYTAGTPAGGPPANIPIQYSFDTPVNQTSQCGRVFFLDWHAESQQQNGVNYTNYVFPNECPGGATGALTTQEKLLEYVVFDLFGSLTLTPTVTWLTPAAVPFGSALGNGQLNATASVPGTFEYTPAAGTVLPIGSSQLLSVTFTPNDTTTYSSVTAATPVSVVAASTAGSPVNLIVTKLLSRSGNVSVQLTIANNGGTDAANVVITSVKVGGVVATPAPQTVGTITAGTFSTATFTVPGSVGASGVASSLVVTGTYTGGTINSSARITLP
jgi:hypothetical protein